MAVTQEDLDNLATQLNELDQNLNAGVAAVQTEVDALEKEIEGGTSGPDLNLDGVKTAVDNLGKEIDEVKDIKPTGKEEGGTEQAPTKPDGTAVDNTTEAPKE